MSFLTQRPVPQDQSPAWEEEEEEEEEMPDEMGKQQVGVKMDNLADEPEMNSTMGTVPIVVTMLGDNLEETNANFDVHGDEIKYEVCGSRKTELAWRQLQWWTEKRYLRNLWLFLITLTILGLVVFVLILMKDWNNREGRAPSVCHTCSDASVAAHFISLSLPLTLNVDGCDVYMPYSTLGRVRMLDASVSAI